MTVNIAGLKTVLQFLHTYVYYSFTHYRAFVIFEFKYACICKWCASDKNMYIYVRFDFNYGLPT